MISKRFPHMPVCCFTVISDALYIFPDYFELAAGRVGGNYGQFRFILFYSGWSQLGN